MTFVNARSPMCRQTPRQTGRTIGSKMMFWQQRTLGRLAAHMLVVWVFALTAGIVNACVVGAESRHDVLSEAQGPSASAATGAHDGAVGAADGDHPPPCGPTDPCARFCADESTRLPTLKQPSAPWTGIWLAPPPSPLAVTAPQDPGQRTARPDALLRRERIPIPIAFLRLTL
ncbi:MAG: hypothetical protein IH627_03720 [Rubrivivax sp.]|nr:hypothetical protein [Rubrivivax sp.]